MQLQKTNYGVKHESPAVIGKPPKIYPWLSEDRHCDICVAGGGLTGALCALAAAEMGLGVVLITSGGVGFGDAGHIMNCAKFDSGRSLTELDRIMSIEDALRLYSAGFQALDDLQNLCRRLDGEYKNTGIKCGFRRRDSLTFTDDPSELELMESEYLTLSKKIAGCTFINRRTAENSFEFPISGGILTKEGGACFNVHSLTHLCLTAAQTLGAEIFEQTKALDIQVPENNDGCVIVKTSTLRTVYADRLILATGGEGIRSMTRHAKRNIIFVSGGTLSEKESGWSGKCILQTYGRQRISCCISDGGEISASLSGKNGAFHGSAQKSIETEKFRLLKKFMTNVVPDENQPEIRYEYAYNYFTTREAMPVIGINEAYKNCIFALCGVPCSPIYSQIAAKSVRNILSGDLSGSEQLFDPMRI